MRPLPALFATALFAVALLSLAGGAGAQTTCTLDQPFLDDVVCVGNATEAGATALASNPTALETLRGWCAANARCAQLYGQDGAPKLDLFVHLFQTTLNEPISAAHLEDPLLDLLCNKTIEEFMEAAWVVTLTSQILDTSVCDINERPVLKDDGTIKCVCRPGSVCDLPSHTLVFNIIMVVVIVVSVVIQIGTSLWRQARLKSNIA